MQAYDDSLVRAFASIVSSLPNGITLVELFVRASHMIGSPVTHECAERVIRECGNDPSGIVRPGQAFQGGRPYLAAFQPPQAAQDPTS